MSYRGKNYVVLADIWLINMSQYTGLHIPGVFWDIEVQTKKTLGYSYTDKIQLAEVDLTIGLIVIELNNSEHWIRGKI